MQGRYDHLPYITKRLWKKAGAGAKYTTVFSKNCCVYASCNFDIQDHLDEGTIIVGDVKTSRNYFYGQDPTDDSTHNDGHEEEEEQEGDWISQCFMEIVSPSSCV